MGGGSAAVTSFRMLPCQVKNLPQLFLSYYTMSHLGKERAGLGRGVLLQIFAVVRIEISCQFWPFIS